MNAAATVTHGGACGALACWSLSLGDLSVIVSMVVSITGLGIQLYMARRKIRRDEERERQDYDGQD